MVRSSYGTSLNAPRGTLRGATFCVIGANSEAINTRSLTFGGGKQGGFLLTSATS